MSWDIVRWSFPLYSIDIIVAMLVARFSHLRVTVRCSMLLQLQKYLFWYQVTLTQSRHLNPWPLLSPEVPPPYSFRLGSQSPLVPHPGTQSLSWAPDSHSPSLGPSSGLSSDPISYVITWCSFWRSYSRYNCLTKLSQVPNAKLLSVPWKTWFFPLPGVWSHPSDLPSSSTKKIHSDIRNPYYDFRDPRQGCAQPWRL